MTVWLTVWLYRHGVQYFNMDSTCIVIMCWVLYRCSLWALSHGGDKLTHALTFLFYNCKQIHGGLQWVINRCSATLAVAVRSVQVYKCYNHKFVYLVYSNHYRLNEIATKALTECRILYLCECFFMYEWLSTLLHSSFTKQNLPNEELTRICPTKRLGLFHLHTKWTGKIIYPPGIPYFAIMHYHVLHMTLLISDVQLYR